MPRRNRAQNVRAPLSSGQYDQRANSMENLGRALQRQSMTDKIAEAREREAQRLQHVHDRQHGNVSAGDVNRQR